MSATRKRKLQEVIFHDQQVHEEQEKQKRYNGPVGKNPWGSIAHAWTAKPKARDFAEDLQIFAKDRGIVGLSGGGGANKPNIRNRLGGIRDWDAPEADFEDMDPISASVHKKKGTRGVSPLGEPILEDDSEDEDAKWNKKLKRPRMTMRADDVQSRPTSAKDRLFSGIKRRVKNSNASTVEVFEEDEEDDIIDVDKHHEPRRDLDLRMTIQTGSNNRDTSSFITGSHKRLNERFDSGGASVSIMSRLDKGNKRRTSRDSLEMDDGEDLRAELDGKHAANMVIQVGHSDSEMMAEDNHDEEEEIAEERVVRKAKPTRTKPASVIQRPIKQEKGVSRSNDAIDSKRDARLKIREREERLASKQKSEKARLQRLRERERERRAAAVRPRLSKAKMSSSRLVGRDKGGRRAAPSSSRKMRIKKEKITDDESSDSSSSDDSSSSSSSGSSDSSSDSDDDNSSDDSSSGSSSSDSESDSDSGRDKRSRKKVVASRKQSSSTSGKSSSKQASYKKGGKASSSSKAGSSSATKDSKDLKNKLSEYLKQAKEKKKKDGKRK